MHVGYSYSVIYEAITIACVYHGLLFSNYIQCSSLAKRMVFTLSFWNSLVAIFSYCLQ